MSVRDPILIFDGELALAEDIPQIRQALGQLPTVTYRKKAFLLLKHREIHALAELANDELNRCQNSDSTFQDHAYFILPHATVQILVVNDAFYAEAKRRNGEWYRAVNRLFPKRERREFNRNIGNLRTLMPKERFMVAGTLIPTDFLYRE